MILPPSVAGLVERHKFEPEVIFLAVGWYLRFSLSYRDAQGTVGRAGPTRRSRHRVAIGPVLCPRKWNDASVGDPTQPTTVGAWTNLMCALKQVGVVVPGGGLERCNDRIL